MFSMAPNIVFAPNMMQNTERKHRMQDTNTAHFQSLKFMFLVICNDLCHFKLKVIIAVITQGFFFHLF